MPRISERQNLLGQIGKLLKTMAMFGDDETDDFEELLDLKAQLESVRFLNSKDHVIKNKSMNEMLWIYGDREFKQIVRMKKQSFERLFKVLRHNRGFGSSDQKHKQAPVWTQVMVVLQRLGNDGSGISLGRCAMNGGFSNWSVCKFC
jgi:hypothetical protein